MPFFIETPCTLNIVQTPYIETPCTLNIVQTPYKHDFNKTQKQYSS